MADLIVDGISGVSSATNCYIDDATLKTYLGVGTSDTSWDTLITMANNAASRSIDQYTHRRFWLDPTPVAQTFDPCHLTMLKLNDDIGDDTSVTIATDASGDGTYETTWAASDFQLLPVNAASASPEAKPWTAIQAVGTRTFPWLVNTWLTRYNRVQVTARYGWPAIPDDVAQACLIKASRLFLRKSSPQGFASFDELGIVRVSRFEDPDVVALLSDYRKNPVLVA